MKGSLFLSPLVWEAHIAPNKARQRTTCTDTQTVTYCLQLPSIEQFWVSLTGVQGFLYQVQKTKSAGTHKHLVHKHFQREEGSCCSKSQPQEVSRTVRHLPKPSVLHSGTLGSSGTYIQQKENNSALHQLPTANTKSI